MASRKILTYGMVISASFAILVLGSMISISGENIYLFGKIGVVLILIYLAFLVFKTLVNIKKHEFFTNRQGLIGTTIYFLIGVACITIGPEQGKYDIVMQMGFWLGIGVTIITLCVLILSLGMWARERWLLGTK